MPYIATQILSTIYGSSLMRYPQMMAFALHHHQDFALNGIYGNVSYNSQDQQKEASLPPASLNACWFVSNDLLEHTMSRIRQGILPDLIELVCSFPVDVDPLNAQQQLRQYCHALAQAGPLGQLRGQELRLALGFRSRKAQYKHLQVLEQTANASEQGHIQGRKNALLGLMDELESALIEQLEQDPCLGKEMFLNKDQKAYPGWMQKILRGLSNARKIFGPT